MHALLNVLVETDECETSEEARDYVDSWLVENGFSGEGSMFSCPPADWFVIGGRWSGENLEKLLNKIKYDGWQKRIEKRLPAALGPDHQKIEDRNNKLARRHFKMVFPGYLSKNDGAPGYRDGYASDGCEDDAMVVNERLWDKLIEPGLAIHDFHEGGSVIQIPDGPEPKWNDFKKADIVGKYWNVIVDFHS